MEACHRGHLAFVKFCVSVVRRLSHFRTLKNSIPCSACLVAPRSVFSTVSTVAVQVESGANVNHSDDFRFTPLAVAAVTDHFDCFAYLAEHGGNVHSSKFVSSSVSDDRELRHAKPTLAVCGGGCVRSLQL